MRRVIHHASVSHTAIVVGVAGGFICQAFLSSYVAGSRDREDRDTYDRHSFADLPYFTVWWSSL